MQPARKEELLPITLFDNNEIDPNAVDPLDGPLVIEPDSMDDAPCTSDDDALLDERVHLELAEDLGITVPDHALSAQDTGANMNGNHGVDHAEEVVAVRPTSSRIVQVLKRPNDGPVVNGRVVKRRHLPGVDDTGGAGADGHEHRAKRLLRMDVRGEGNPRVGITAQIMYTAIMG